MGMVSVALLKLCKCGKKIKINALICEQCQDKQKDRHKAYDKFKRDKTSAAFYHSKEWKIVRKQALIRDNNLCVKCLQQQKIKTADMVDHIIPISEEWRLRLTLSNLQSLCNSCHNQKTADDKRLYRG